MSVGMIEYLKGNSIAEFSQNGDGGISVVDNPGLVFGNKGDSVLAGRIIARLTNVAGRGFGKKLDEATADGVGPHILESDAVAIVHSRDDVLGFASARKLEAEGVKIFWIHGIVILPELKETGASGKLLDALLSLRTEKLTAFTTQNPISYSLMASVCETVSPSPENRIVPEKFRKLGKALVSDRPGQLDLETFVSRGLYESCLYEAIPKCRKAKTNDWFDQSLHMENRQSTDGFLAIGKTPLS